MSDFGMSPSETVEALVRRGVPREAAERQHGERARRRQAESPPERPAIQFPVRLTIPWSKLCSDNEKERGAMVRGTDGELKPRKLLTERYKASKSAITSLAKSVVGDVEPTREPLSIEVRVYLPPARRNDSVNFAKVLGDSLEKVVFLNDNQLWDSRWIRAGVDIDAPRADVLISRLTT